jgi:hypothetical protein
MQQQENNIVNLLNSGNKYQREDQNNDTEVVNFYIDNDGIMRSFYGFETILSIDYPQFIKILIDRSGNYVYAISTFGLTILDKDFNVIFLLPFIINNEMPEHIPSPDKMSMVEDVNGHVILTSGGACGVFLVTITRSKENAIINAKMTQLDYFAFPTNTNIIGLSSGKEIVALFLPSAVEYLDTKIIILDYFLGKFYIFTNLFSNAQTLDNNVFAIQSIPCDIVAIKRVKRTLCAIGTKCVEFWYSTADEIGLTRYSNQLIESGTIFPNSISVINGRLFYLGCNENSSSSVYIIDFTETKDITIEKNNLSFYFENISNDSYVWASNFSPSDLNFYVLTINQRTILLDVDNHTHTYLSETGSNPFPANDIFRFQNQWFFPARREKATLCKMSSNFASYDNKPIPLNITTGIIRTEENDTFGIESIDFAIRPISAYYQDFSKQQFLKETEESLYHIYCQFSKNIGSNKDLTSEFELRILPKEIFGAKIKDARLPKGRILLQITFRFLTPKIQGKYLPMALQTFNLNLI